MKTAALVLGLGLGCAAAGLPGDAAAGQPLEKRLERARRLSADACATETTTFSTCLADASITFTPATPAGPWASCADVQAEVAGICAAGPAACEVEYHTYTECLYEYMLTSSYGASCDLTCASSTRTPAPTPVWKSKFYGAFVLNHRGVLHAIDATPARWRGDASSSPFDRASTAAPSPRNDLVKNYGYTRHTG